MKKVPSTGDMQKIAVAKRKLEENSDRICERGCERDSHDFCTHHRIHDHPSLVMVGATVSLVASSASLVSMTSSLDDDDDEYLP
jgi:hypothetical protein